MSAEHPGFNRAGPNQPARVTQAQHIDHMILPTPLLQPEIKQAATGL
jgi:hypothetical protein